MTKLFAAMGFAMGFIWALSVPAASQEATFVSVAVPVPSTEIVTQVAAVCSHGLVLSEKATVACATQTFPKLNRDGTKFVNQGVGTEFNVLIANLGNMKSAE